MDRKARHLPARVRLSLAQVIDPNRPDMACDLVRRWQIHPLLALRIVGVATALPFPLAIISGFRTDEQQRRLGASGRPTAPVDVSTHTECPASGADLWPTVAATSEVKATMGLRIVENGLRWGGGSPVDPQNLIPSDWNHVDLGARQR